MITEYFFKTVIVFLICVSCLKALRILTKRKRRRCHGHHGRRLAIYINGVRGDGMTQIKNNLPAAVSVEANGALDGLPSFSLSDQSFGTLTPSEDGMSASFVPSGSLGTFHISVTAMAGGNQISASEDVEVVQGPATELKITITQ